MPRRDDFGATPSNPHEQFLQECDAAAPADTKPTDVHGTVVGLHRLGCVVEVEGRRFECKRVKDEDVCVGDLVVLSSTGGQRGIIRHRLPRRSWYYRGLSGGQRIKSVAANMDAMVIVVSAAEPETPAGLIDRFLVLATLGRMKAIICLTKVDLVDEAYVEAAFAPYAQTGATCLPLATLEQRGVDRLRAVLQDRHSIFCGHSGVGKSTLINALVGEGDRLRTGDISAATGKGMHTTTWVDWIRVDETTVLVDTPGIKHISLGMLRPADLAAGFAEFAALAGECRFDDCRHQSEPDCAVLEALASNDVHATRHARYLAIQANP